MTSSVLTRSALKSSPDPSLYLTWHNTIFGNKIVILRGDFKQLLPIKEDATGSELISLSIKLIFLWDKFQKFKLIENMRVLTKERHSG